MQILHIDTEKTWRGGENQIRLLVEALATQHGVTSHLAVQPGSAMAQRLGAQAPLHVVRMRHELDLAAAASIARYCRAQGITLLDAHTSHAHSLGLLAKRFFNPELRLVVHRRVAQPPRAGWLNAHKYRHHAIDRYIAISAAIAQTLREFGIPAERITTVASAIACEPYRDLDRVEQGRLWRQRLGLPEGVLLLGQAAAMTPDKGYATLLTALARLRALDPPPFHCILAGDGPLRAELEAQSAQLGLREVVSFVGWQAEIPQLLTGLDIFVMASLTEGLGTSILEAVEAGSCVVASRVGGIPEIIRDGETGLLATAGDPDTLAAQLARVLRAPHLRAQLSRQAKRHTATHFSLANMVAGNLAVYRELTQAN